MQALLLHEGWRACRADPATARDIDASGDGWMPAPVPGTIHEALIAADRLENPFVGMNEVGAQWIGEADWLYQCTFEVPASFLEPAAVDLCCDGLDTIATVWLNGMQVLRSDNMFVPQRVSVRQHLREGHNELRILLASALLKGREREQAHGRMEVWNGEPSRVYVRKAQYHYGWDWGPTLLTAGIWRPIRLEAYDARIADVHCPIEVAADLQSATLPVRVEIVDADAVVLPLGAQHAGHLPLVSLALHGPDKQVVAAATVSASDGVAEHTFQIEHPALWWPRGYGDQPLYELHVSLERAQIQEVETEVRLGIRRLELIQEPIEGEAGTSFYFRVNNTPIFCGGANWIPADSFTTRISADRYRALLQQAADAHMNMVRIWGGGIYEDEAFYDACDELGLLVWQDFMFGCGIYPAADWFQASVRAEAQAQLRRLRHHACIALWCGNNEDYQIAYSLGRYHHDLPPDGDAGFPARVIYEGLLPEVCAAYDPTRPYWPGSPWLGANPDDQTIGDRHTWEVWGRNAADYKTYPQLEGRFVSEFGMAAMPDLATIESFTTEDERYAGSRTIEFHNKATGGARRMASYQADNLRPVASLADTIYATQLIQAEALAAAYQGWRRRWGGPNHYAVAGALVWQLDDCWPVTSWSVIDYYGRPKPAYYVIRRALAPLSLGIATSDDSVQVWAVNGTRQPRQGKLELRTWTLDGELIGVERADVTLADNRASELGVFGFRPGENTVFDARLLVNGTVVARTARWPEPYKYLHLPDPMIVVDLEGRDTIR
ncbi:MAG TPA: glycoside hydrolase family 2 protein, partial [Roseiflexaceae bacterium]|nr:glycoside hydrolase family 2 protein [Roseiflexaceae bacterium]